MSAAFLYGAESRVINTTLSTLTAVLLLPFPSTAYPQSWQVQSCCDTPNCYEHPEVWDLGESVAGLLGSVQNSCFLPSVAVIFKEAMSAGAVGPVHRLSAGLCPPSTVPQPLKEAADVVC